MNPPVLKLELTADEAQIILNGLVKLPYEMSFTLIHKIKTEGDKIFTPPTIEKENGKAINS
jgi:hypothetical protein